MSDFALTSDDIVRFQFAVQKGAGCWEWAGYRDDEGYGVFYSSTAGGARRNSMPAHRAAFFIAFGVLPGPIKVRHKCDNRPCVRPDHLVLGTQAENMRDMVERGRSLRGDRHPSRRYPHRLARGAAHWTHRRPELVARGPRTNRTPLTPESVLQIRVERAAGASLTALGKKFGVDRSTIHNVVARKTWGHV